MKLASLLLLITTITFAQKKDTVKSDPAHPKNEMFLHKIAQQAKRDSLNAIKQKKQPARKTKSKSKQ